MFVATVGSRKLLWIRSVAVSCLVMSPLVAVNGLAQDTPARQEIREGQRLLELKVKEAEELKARGRVDAADAVMKEAQALKARIAAAREAVAAREKKGGEPDSLISILDGLERGMGALKQLGRQEELKMLGRVADEVRARLSGGPRDRRQVLTERLELMQLALSALQKADRKEVEIISGAIGAIEIKLEGRNDERAHAILENEPQLAHQVECLRLAARLLQQSGNPDHARKIQSLSDEMWAPTEKKQDLALPMRKEPGGGDREELIQQIRKLEKRVAELEEVIRRSEVAPRETKN